MGMSRVQSQNRRKKYCFAKRLGSSYPKKTRDSNIDQGYLRDTFEAIEKAKEEPLQNENRI